MNQVTTLCLATIIFAFFLLAFLHVNEVQRDEIERRRFLIENGFYLDVREK